jgi:hypothetical protein
MYLSKADKRLLSIILLALVISGVTIIADLFSFDRDAKKRSATAAAEIVSVAPTNWNDSQRKTKYGFRVNYRFQADGYSVEAVDGKNQSYKPGGRYRVCYNPNDLADSSLHSLQDADCGSGFLF